MKLSIVELRDMVAQAVRQTVREAKKARLPAERSEESVVAQRDRQVRALPGYAHSKPLDMSKPLGRRNRVKRQGAANFGAWTSESRGGRAIPLRSPAPRAPAPTTGDEGGAGTDNRLLNIMIMNGVPPEQAQRIARQYQAGPTEARRFYAETAVRKLVGMIVDEEVRVSGRR